MREPAARFRRVAERSDAQAEAGCQPGSALRSGVNELPSVALTTKFPALCQQYGAERLAVKIVVSGRRAGVSGLPGNDDWTMWNAEEMRAAVEHLQRKCGARAPRR